MSHSLPGIFLRGIAMGSADVVPGVSGGTVAFITGIYERLIQSLSAFDLEALRAIAKGQWAQAWRHVDGSFLLCLLAGVACAILTLARGISFLLDTQPVLIHAVFFGLIAGSAWVITRQIADKNVKTLLSFAVGIAVMLLLAAARPEQLPLEPQWLFLGGSLAICAMILPGLSGSFILLMLGLYEPVLQAIKGFDIVVMLWFAAGCGVGLLSFVRVLKFLLQRFYQPVLAFLAGLLLASLTVIWPWKVPVSDWQSVNVSPMSYQAQQGDPQLAFACVLAVVAALAVLAIERWAGRVH